MPCRSPRTAGSPARSCWPASAPPCAAHGAPASTLTDNGMVFTTRFSGGKGGRNGLEHELRRLGINAEERQAEPPPDPGQSRAVPADPQELARAPSPQPATLAQLQALLDTFTSDYNTSGRTGPCPTGPPPPPPMPPGPKPPPATAPPTPTTGSAPTSIEQHRHRHPAPPAASLYHIGIGRAYARNRHPAPGPGHPHPHHQRRHRRTPPRAHPRPHPQLPAHRPATQAPP